jgi:pimeloyl-ACP methyl ester carboxylesterase
MKKRIAALGLAATVLFGAAAAAQTAKPTIVLVHGAFADSSSWDGVVRILERDGYHVVAAANPLRSVRSDTQYVSDILSSIPSSVVLVGHSYGGMVISSAASGHANVTALVYVSAFAPEVGESAADLAGKFPGSTLGSALAAPVSLADGNRDLYIQQERFRDQFAADVAPGEAALMAAGQRPITELALNEKSDAAIWKTIPSWFVYGDKDKNIPPAALAYMAERAHAKEREVIKGASHVVMVSHPNVVARVIEDAASGK